MTTSPDDQFRDAIRSRNIIPPDQLIGDGAIHRCDAEGTNGKGDAAYVLYTDGIPAGWFENHRDGLGVQTWRADIGRPLAPVESAALADRERAMREQRDRDLETRREEAQQRAIQIWKSAPIETGSHPYVVRKGVKPHGTRRHKGTLVIPMRDVGGKIHSLQFIDADGSKRFLTGGRKKGCYFAIGQPAGTIVIAEGFATAASIHEVTGHAVAIAFDASNLLPVGQALRGAYPTITLIVAADDDAQTDGNPGLTKATEAAKAIGALLAVPEFGPGRLATATDYNDLAATEGADAVKRSISAAKRQEVSTPQPISQNAPERDLSVRVLDLRQLLTREFPEREPILAPWLLTQSLNMIYAWRGIGKTHMALGIGFATATGGKFLKWEAPRPRRVLYLDGEMPGAAIRDRLRALVDADDREFDPSYFQIVTPDAQDGPLPDLATAAGQATIERIAAEHDSELIVVDNISTLCRASGPENDAESWRAPQEWALRMRRAGRSVLFIHHSGKGGAQRGSSKREDTLDVSISLTRPTDYSPEQDARFEIHFEKYRNAAGEDAKPIEARLETDGRGQLVWTWRTVEEGTYERVVALANDGLKPGEIAAELDINKSNVSRHMKRGKLEGQILTGSQS